VAAAGPTLHGGNLSPNLQAQFCKLDPADLSIAIHLFLCSRLLGFVWVSFNSKIHPWIMIFQTRLGAFCHAKRVGF